MENYKKINKQLKAYESIFLIENKLRVSMHNIMVQKIGPDYFNEKVFPEYEYTNVAGSKKINIRKSALERRGTERKYNIKLGYDYPYFWYLDFTLLISLIDVFWDEYFHEVFNTTKKFKSDLLSRLNNIHPTRNAIAHNRYISDIDLHDLESILKILNISFNEHLLIGFEEIALNSFENLIIRLGKSLRDLNEIIGTGEYINREILRELKSNFSALLSSFDGEEEVICFTSLINLLYEYNKLPRKPGRGSEIKTFVQENDLTQKISFLIERIGKKK